MDSLYYILAYHIIFKMTSFRKCVFDCNFCLPDRDHICRKCKARNNHRTADCPGKTGCTLNCGFCVGTQEHLCNKCGATNHHRSSNCDNKMNQPPLCIIITKTHCVTSKTTAPATSKTTAPATSKTTARVTSNTTARVTSNITARLTSNTTAPVTSNTTARVTSNTTARVSSLFVKKSRMNGKDIINGAAIVVSFQMLSENPYIFVHGDAVGRGSRTNTKYGLIMSSGGNIEDGANAYDSAIKEDMEEQGLSSWNDLRYYGSNSNGPNSNFHYFSMKASANWYSGNVTTPNEVTRDVNHIPNHFKSEFVIKTGVPTTFGVSLISLLESDLVYGPLKKILRDMKSNGVFV
jgi:ribosomal protein L40E